MTGVGRTSGGNSRNRMNCFQLARQSLMIAGWRPPRWLVDPETRSSAHLWLREGMRCQVG
jgi:hypothetical protein